VGRVGRGDATVITIEGVKWIKEDLAFFFT
jgi:hypothetical protein